MKKIKLPNAVAILVLTLITVVMWVSFSIYHAVGKKPDVKIPAEVSKPLTPTLDTEVINMIESRTYLDDSQIPQNVVTGPILLGETKPVATPVATQEGTQEQLQTEEPAPDL